MWPLCFGRRPPPIPGYPMTALPPGPAAVPLRLLLALALALAGCAGLPARRSGPAPGAAEAAVRAVLEAQAAAWNAGDLRGFMTGYVASDSLTFISNGRLRRGWQASLDAYVRGYPDRAAMGHLTFEDLEVLPLGPDHALVLGRFRLRTTAPAAADETGLFSLVFGRDAGGAWRVLHDHTSTPR